MLLRGAVVTRIAMSNEELEVLKSEVSAAADFLLPLAKATDWPCRLELIAWLIALRDSFHPRDTGLH